MTYTKQDEIDKIRSTINQIDSTLLSLLKKRFECAREIGHLKEANTEEKYDPRREEEIFRRILAENDNDFPEHALKTIFSEIIGTCRRQQ